MSRQPQAGDLVPAATARVARAAFPKGTAARRMQGAWGRLSAARACAALVPPRGPPALAPARLARVPPTQFAAGRSDRQAAEAARGRRAWKYALCPEPADPGFASAVRSEFRARLPAQEREGRLFARRLARCREAGLARAGGSGPTRPGCWRRSGLSTGRSWSARRGGGGARPSGPPATGGSWTSTGARQNRRRARRWRPGAVRAPGAPAWRREVPAAETPRPVWGQRHQAPGAAGTPGWRAAGASPPGAVRITAPRDPAARRATKRAPRRTGDQAHPTEACGPAAPLLRARAQTTAAAPAARAARPASRRGRAAACLLPGAQRVAAG
jgi:hypothetical protein